MLTATRTLSVLVRQLKIMPKAVLIRLDKIGDLISTLPVDEIELFKDHEIHWVIAQGLGFIPQNAVPKRNFIELNPKKKWASFKKLIQFLEEKEPEIAISFQAPWWVSLALWVAHVPLRVGSLSQWHSLLFLNAGLRQKRSLARQHESDYNADLVYHAWNKVRSPEQIAPILKLKAPTEISLAPWNLQSKKYIVVHPGMAGSALNWKTESYLELIEKLKQKNLILITGTPADEPWLQQIKIRFKDDPQVLILQNKLSAPELLRVLAEALFVIAPSTGVLHLAASLGVPCAGIYSPIQVQHPTRWKARGSSNVSIFVPPVPCPARFHCLGSKCTYYYCMDQITVSQVLNSVNEVIK